MRLQELIFTNGLLNKLLNSKYFTNCKKFKYFSSNEWRHKHIYPLLWPLLREGHNIVFNIWLFSLSYWDYTFISYPYFLSEVSKQPVALVEENCKKIEILIQFLGEIPKFQNTDLSWKFLCKKFSR